MFLFVQCTLRPPRDVTAHSEMHSVLLGATVGVQSTNYCTKFSQNFGINFNCLTLLSSRITFKAFYPEAVYYLDFL